MNSEPEILRQQTAGHDSGSHQRVVSPTVHYSIEYGVDGLPTRLIWSKEIQAAGEENVRKYRAKITEEFRKSRKPMQSYLEWARERGLWD